MKRLLHGGASRLTIEVMAAEIMLVKVICAKLSYGMTLRAIFLSCSVLFCSEMGTIVPTRLIRH
jgi:hypothetical protein